jgi:hypothetical protein
VLAFLLHIDWFSNLILPLAAIAGILLFCLALVSASKRAKGKQVYGITGNRAQRRAEQATGRRRR